MYVMREQKTLNIELKAFKLLWLIVIRKEGERSLAFALENLIGDDVEGIVGGESMWI